jgi:hypothetical protein
MLKIIHCSSLVALTLDLHNSDVIVVCYEIKDDLSYIDICWLFDRLNFQPKINCFKSMLWMNCFCNNYIHFREGIGQISQLLFYNFGKFLFSLE